MRTLILFILPLIASAQEIGIGQWKGHQSYTSATYIVDAEKKIYCVASGSLFYVDKNDNSLSRMSKITGLSDVDIKKIAYSDMLDLSIITYQNCNIDIIQNGQIINLSDIKRKEIVGIKSINNIRIHGEIAYLSCSFGLVLVDLIKKEIKETYSIQKNEILLEINDCAFVEDSQIIAATSLGVYYGNTSSVLNDPANWVLSGTEMNADKIIRNNNIGCVLYKGSDGSFLDVFYPSNLDLFQDTGLRTITYSNNVLYKVYKEFITLSNNGINTLDTIKNDNLLSVNHAISDKDGNVWAADSINSLLKFNNYYYQENYSPEGPKSNDVYSLDFLEDELFICHGGHFNFGVNYLNTVGASIMQNNYSWKNEGYYDLGWAWDILKVAVHDGKEYYASWYDGISVLNGDIKEDVYRFIKQYGYENTGGALDTTYYSNNRIRISDLKFDSEGNLWGLSSEVPNPLFVKTKEGTWHSFTMNQGVVDLFFDELLIDSYGQKWGVIGREGGVFVYTDNGSIDNPSDDEFKILNTFVGNGNLPSKQVYSIVEDLNNYIWVGTDKGIGVFYNPSLIFSNYNFDAQQIIIQEGDYGQYLLSEEKIKSIAIDGANRKWIGTEKSGVFVLSEDGTKEIAHFTSENSPLFSNNIIDISINPKNGEVFIGTSKGVISYKSDATAGEELQGETTVFPNPVKETYYGPIAIDGLINNANFKITDIDGSLVFEGNANGGRALWDGKNKNNKRVSTGVYLVFSVNDFGKEKMVSKILFIK